MSSVTISMSSSIASKPTPHMPSSRVRRSSSVSSRCRFASTAGKRWPALEALAKRLGKDVEVIGSAGRLRSDPAVWAPFWNAFTHVVRTAIDHGIEPEAARQKRGKPGRATLRIDVVRSSSCVIIGASDDGGGNDRFKVAKKAGLHGLPAETPGDLERAHFFAGLST